MRKSTAVRLVLLGSASLALAACDEAPPADAQFFSDVSECAAIHDEETCRKASEESLVALATAAPRFTTKEECEAEFGGGNCESEATSGGGSFFLPMMMGYMMGSAFSQPVYRGPDNTATVRTGGKTYKVGAFAGTGRVAAFQPAAITEVSRGGLGSTGNAYRTSSGG